MIESNVVVNRFLKTKDIKKRYEHAYITSRTSNANEQTNEHSHKHARTRTYTTQSEIYKYVYLLNDNVLVMP